MKIRRIKVLLAKGWCKVVCFVSFSLLTVVCNHASAQNSGNVIRGVAGVKIDTVLMSIDEAIEELERIPGYGMVFDDEASFVNTKFENGYGYVDLGLSVKWAMCNVGAERPEEYGDYFAWGELEPKESYTWENYRFGVGEELPFKSKLSKYNTDRNRGVVDNKTTLDLVDDVANVRWGGSWRMPTLEEWTELRQNCTWTVDSINGVKGLRATSNKPGKTDRSIFLPEADYWSSSLEKLPLYAMGLTIHDIEFLNLDIVMPRERGCPVRPVHP